MKSKTSFFNVSLLRKDIVRFAPTWVLYCAFLILVFSGSILSYDRAYVAESLGENIEQVFKTLVLHGDKSGHFVCVIPGEHEVNLKKAAKVSGNKKCDLIPMKELLPLTGYIRGGCSPIGMKKHFPTYIHESCQEFEHIYVSAGVRGLQIKIAPQDLIQQSRAIVCNLLDE